MNLRLNIRLPRDSTSMREHLLDLLQCQPQLVCTAKLQLALLLHPSSNSSISLLQLLETLLMNRISMVMKTTSVTMTTSVSIMMTVVTILTSIKMMMNVRMTNTAKNMVTAVMMTKRMTSRRLNLILDSTIRANLSNNINNLSRFIEPLKSSKSPNSKVSSLSRSNLQCNNHISSSNSSSLLLCNNGSSSNKLSHSNSSSNGCHSSSNLCRLSQDLRLNTITTLSKLHAPSRKSRGISLKDNLRFSNSSSSP